VTIDRYHRQILLPQIGRKGQARLAAARVLLVGCGALGSVIAEQLVRGGIGFLRLVDRDVVELTNLQRQVLFDEADARDATPKAIAAVKRLSALNSEVRVEPHVSDLSADNVESLMRVGGEWVDLILDGTDNVETRYLINDAAVKLGVPWVYGACVGTEGRVMSIEPGVTACLRCLFPQPPGPGELPTCDTAGVLAPVAAMVASAQVVATMRILAQDQAGELVRIDGWNNTMRSSSTADARLPDCPTCGQRRFEFLDSPARSTVRLCGRDAVQIRPSGAAVIDLKRLAVKLSAAGAVRATPYLLRFQAQDEPTVEVTVFADGRAVMRGITDASRARSIYARYVGS
jgi:adenylyltransferase/sulfurtransferase